MAAETYVYVVLVHYAYDGSEIVDVRFDEGEADVIAADSNAENWMYNSVHYSVEKWKVN
jgi:hypothetical protein